MRPSEIQFVNPNLPENNVYEAAVNYNAAETIASLKKYGIKCIEICNNQYLNTTLASHPDINLLNIKKGYLFLNKGISAGEGLEKFETEFTDEDVNDTYPGDVRLNCVVIGKKLICNKDTVSKKIIDFAYNNSYTIIHSKQGYSKCSVCVVNEECIITDDESIYKSVQNYFNDVLLVAKGSVLLNGYYYGFIGGASGIIGKNKLAFNGRIDSHPDCNSIIDLAAKYNVEIIELINSRLTDIGSIIPLTEIKPGR